MVGEHLHGGGQLIARGVGSGVEQDKGEIAHLVMGELLAIVFDSDEVGDQVVSQRVPASLDQLLEVTVERVPRPKDRGLVFGDGAAEGLADVGRPLGEELPILARRTEHGADDRNRIVVGDVGDEVAVADRGNGIDEFVDDVDACGTHPVGCARGEGPCNQPSEAVVFGSVEADEQVSDSIPHRARGDALDHQPDASRHHESGIPQHRAHQFVVEELGTVGTERDRRMLARDPDRPVDRVGVPSVAVVDSGQGGVEDARALRGRGHGSDYPAVQASDHRPRGPICRAAMAYASRSWSIQFIGHLADEVRSAKPHPGYHDRD
jgi:hypothetical protein